MGQIDYGEGISGLVRALRTAGARHVLVTQRPISDEGAADFIERFYRHWLAQAESDPPPRSTPPSSRPWPPHLTAQPAVTRPGLSSP